LLGVIDPLLSFGVVACGDCGAGGVRLGVLPRLASFVKVERFVNELSDGVVGVDGELTPVPLLELLLLLSEPVPP
jgi:hypothetical protein